MKLLDILFERPKIDLIGKKAYGNNKLLRDLTLEEVSGNILFFREDKGNFIVPEGLTIVYFMDSEESAQKIASGELPMLMLPLTAMRGMFNQTTPFYKALRGKKNKHILGFIQGFTDEDAIYVSFMKVRTGYRRNTINSKMMQILKNKYPNAEVIFEDPTELGNKFIDKKYPDAEKRKS